MNIYVGNLSYEVTEADLKTEFEAFGEVTSVSIIKDNYSGQSKGFGFVEMPKLTEGQAAITGLNGKQIKGRAVTVNGARPKGEGGPRVVVVEVEEGSHTVAGKAVVMAAAVAVVDEADREDIKKIEKPTSTRY